MSESSPLPERQFQELKEALSEHYEVQGLIGEGGMGIVYQAHDRRHDRQVALKILRPEIAVSVGEERFLREIRIEAGLNHPHILPVYDSGAAGGLLYCVMPFIDGESLSERLKREKQLPVNEALRICREIADALMFAHGHGVIHRDVKPGNILLEAGHAILADFGLAKAMTAGDDQALTRTGLSVGTPAYSSPEQAAADDTDGRTDLYSLGCVLYEMLAGRVPFVGPTSNSVVRQHITAEPTAVSILRPAVPEGVEDVLDQLLAKSPADRFSTAEALVRALDAAISGEFPKTKRASRKGKRGWQRHLLPAASLVVLLGVFGPWLLDRLGPAGRADGTLFDRGDLAVLYFDDLSPDGGLQHVADGLTEGLIDDLTRVGNLEVVSRNGVAPYRGSDAPLDSIAEALEVGTLIRGSVEQLEDRLRVSIHLVEGMSGTDFDRSTFDVAATEFLAARDSVVQEVAWLLRERLGEEVRLRRRQAATSSVEAWAFAQRGERERKRAEALVGQGDLDDFMRAFARADSFFALAEAADPDWVEPPTQRGWVEFREARLAPELENKLTGIERSMAYAAQALEIDANHASALELRGTLRYWHWNLGVTADAEEAEEELFAAREDLEAAVDADPKLASAHATLSHLHYWVSDRTTALLSALAAYEADAFASAAPDILHRLFLASYDSEQFTQARSACSEGRRRFPDDYRFSECSILELALPAGTPNIEEAWRFQGQAVALAPEADQEYEHHRTLIMVAEVLARAELPDSSRAVLMLARAGADVDPTLELSFLEAYVRVVLGDYEEAVERLTSYTAGFYGGGGGDSADWATHWWWKDIRGHEGFERLVEATR